MLSIPIFALFAVSLLASDNIPIPEKALRDGSSKLFEMYNMVYPDAPNLHQCLADYKNENPPSFTAMKEEFENGPVRCCCKGNKNAFVMTCKIENDKTKSKDELYLKVTPDGRFTGTILMQGGSLSYSLEHHKSSSWGHRMADPSGAHWLPDHH